MEFSKKLRELRLQRGISQTKLAADIHISRSAVAKWETDLILTKTVSRYTRNVVHCMSYIRKLKALGIHHPIR